MSKRASRLCSEWATLALALCLLAACGSAQAPGQPTSGTPQVGQSTETPSPAKSLEPAGATASPTGAALPPPSSEVAEAMVSPTAPTLPVTSVPSIGSPAVTRASATASATHTATVAATPRPPQPTPSPRPPAPAAPQDATHEAFIRQVAPWAQAEQNDSGVPASFSIALAASETGWGVSPLMKQYNNYMMVSCSQPNEGLQCVRYGNGMWNQYSSPEQAFLWHGRWLKANAGFAEAFKHTDDAAVFTRLVARCYVSCAGPFPQAFYDGIMRIIDEYNLRQFDSR